MFPVMRTLLVGLAFLVAIVSADGVDMTGLWRTLLILLLVAIALALLLAILASR